MRRELSCTAASFVVAQQYQPKFCLLFRRFAGERDKTMFTPIIRFIQRWNRYGVDVQALSNLSDRELADMGINRCDIHRVAKAQSR